MKCKPAIWVVATLIVGLAGCQSPRRELPEKPATPAYRVVLQWGSPGDGAGEFEDIQGLVAGSDGMIYVADAENCRMQAFDAAGQFILSWGRCGSGPGEFQKPTDAAVDARGRVYVTDFMLDRVQVFDTRGKFLRAWGRAGKREGEFSAPVGVAVDSQGNVYVSEFYNHRVQNSPQKESSSEAGAAMAAAKDNCVTQPSFPLAWTGTFMWPTRTTTVSRNSIRMENFWPRGVHRESGRTISGPDGRSG